MGYAEANDFVLLQRFTEMGDQQAFCEIVRRYAGMVFAVCRRILNDRARAEEVSQETFFKLMIRPESVSQSLGGWLHRAATRLAVDERRSDSSRRRREAQIAQEARELVEETPSNELRWADIAPHLDEALAQLPDRSRTLLIRHFLEGKQQQDLAREANVSAATISRRIKLAADELRRELRRRGLDVMPMSLITLWATQSIETAPLTLQHGLAKMAMVSGAKGVAAKSICAVVRRAGAALRSSAAVRWAAAMLLSGLIVISLRVEERLGILDRSARPAWPAPEVAPAASLPAPARPIGRTAARSGAGEVAAGRSKGRSKERSKGMVGASLALTPESR